MKKRFFIGLIPLLLSGAITSCYGNDDEPIEEEKKQEEEKPKETEEVKQYVITWKDYDGTILATSTVKEGVKPTYPKTTPTREADEDYTYEFANWYPSIVEAKENTTYTASYNGTPIEKEEEDGFFTLDSDVSPLRITFKDLVTNGGNHISLEKINDGTEWIITSSDFQTIPNKGKLVIPSKYEGLKIVGIGEGAFVGQEKLEEIVFSNALKTIDDEAFSDTGLTSVTLPANLESCGYSAFSNNFSLKTVNINCSNCDFGVEIEGDASAVGCTFNGCEALEEVKFVEGTTVIAPGMFEWCAALASVTLPSTVKTICDSAFGFCEALTSIELPEGLERINFNAFMGIGIENITLPSSLTYTDSAFVDCESLQYAIIKSPSSNLGLTYTNFGRSGIEAIFYEGSKEDFDSKVEVILEYTKDNDVPDTALINSEDEENNIEILYYSETSAANSWHYVNNVPTRW